ncbi:MAG: YbjN domain-containing protein [Bacteroidota bacterium]|nr:YbjN domain-containing protein [Bacteroidota bacterium]
MAKLITETRKNIKAYLKNIYGRRYGEVVLELDKTFVIKHGSAAVHLSIHRLSRNECVVRALAYVVQGARITPQLMRQLLRLNVTFPLGAYGILFDDTITFSHSIVAANLDENELHETIRAVAHVADETDDQIRAVAGGMRAVDANASIIGAEVGPAAAPSGRARKAAGKKRAARTAAKSAGKKKTSRR